jgi:hypothetical protein
MIKRGTEKTCIGSPPQKTSIKKIIAQQIFYVLAISSVCDQVLSSSEASTDGKYDTEI